jgi:hypothetical protein
MAVLPTASGLNPLIETTPTSAVVYSGRTAKKIILSQIIASEKNQNNISSVYKETLRTMIRIFNDLFYIDSENKVVGITCMHGSPERTIAKLKQETNIILPIISITQTTSDDDVKRRKTNYTLVQEKWWDETKQRAYRIVSFAPRAVNIQYSINVWTKYKSNMDQITEQIRTKFFPGLDINTEQSTLTQAFLTEELDESTVDIGDQTDRVLRKSFNVDVQTYIPSAKYLVTSTGQIEKFSTEAVITNKIV